MGHVNFEELYDVVKALRHPETGCPWDLEQNHQTLLKYLLEESYEFFHSVESENTEQMEEEIGDILLQVLLHCELASEKNNFTLESVAKKLSEKLIRRHPHVFENKGQPITMDEIINNWQKTKTKEKKEKNKDKEKLENLIDQSDLRFPALLSAKRIGDKTKAIGFDWDDPVQVSYKVEEEWQELKEEMVKTKIDKEKIEEELGDFLFSTAQLARHFNLDPEETLRKANQKFITRFNSMEKLIKEASLDIEQLNQQEMDKFWLDTKRREKEAHV